MGISNQYGYEFRNPDDLENIVNFGSSISHMNPVLDDSTPMNGPLLGTFMGMVDSVPDFSKFQTPESSKIQNLWRTLRSKNKKVPAIYIGYTIGTNFSKINPKLLSAKNAAVTVNLSDFSHTIGTKNASYNASPGQAFIRMALMLDNQSDNLVTHGQNMMENILAEKRHARDEEQMDALVSRNATNMII